MSTCLAPNQASPGKGARPNQNKFTGGLLGYAGPVLGGGGAVARFVVVALASCGRADFQTTFLARARCTNKKIAKMGDA